MTNQSNYKNNQNYQINIENFYNTIVSEIDDIRGYVNISSPDNLKKVKTIKPEDFSGISGKLQVSDTYQESRISAFLRLIGLPVISNSGAFYNPGHDGIKYLTDPIFNTRQIKTKNKVDIINNPINGFYNFSNKKEAYYNSTVVNNLSYRDINTSLYLLTSYNLRNFNDHIDKYQNAFDFELENHSYLVKLSDPLNRSLLEYIESPKLIAKRYHFIFPLINDPRLDLCAIKRPSVPFPFKKSHLQINPTLTAKIPLLQTIIENRYLSQNRQGEIGQFGQQIVDFVKSNEKIKDEKLINNIQDPTSYGIVEREMFLKFINLISSMVDELIQAQSDIDLTFSITTYLPICNPSGPEAGVKTLSVDLFTDKFNTDLDKEIKLFLYKDFINNLTPQTNLTNTTADTIGEKITEYLGSVIDYTAEAFGNLIKDTLSSLLKRKTVFDNKASDALRKIEIIMGEFSGLGLCDIIAILGAMYLVERKFLLGLLDDDAFLRASKKLNISNEERPPVQESIIELQKTVFGLYNIMQIIYTERKQFGIRV